MRMVTSQWLQYTMIPLEHADHMGNWCWDILTMWTVWVDATYRETYWPHGQYMMRAMTWIPWIDTIYHNTTDHLSDMWWDILTTHTDHTGNIWWDAWMCDTEWMDALDVQSAWMGEALRYVMRWTNRHEYVGHRTNRHLEAQDTEWIRMFMWHIWRCETLGYVRHLDMWSTWWTWHWMNKHWGVRDAWMCGTEWIGTWICETLGNHTLGYVRHLETIHSDMWDTWKLYTWICYTLWRPALGDVRHLDMLYTMTLGRPALGDVRHLDMWSTWWAWRWMNKHSEVWDTQKPYTRICETLGYAIHYDTWTLSIRRCDKLGYVALNEQALGYVRHLETIHSNMRDTWKPYTRICGTLGNHILGCVRHWMNKHSDVWDTEWIGTWIYETLGNHTLEYGRHLDMWDTEWISTRICEILGYAIHSGTWRHEILND